MALPAPIQAILTRLRGSNNNAYNAGSNPLGMGQGGHRQNFNPRLGDVADLSDWMSSTADTVEASRAEIATNKQAASDSAGAAAQSASDAAGSVTAAAAQAQRLAGTSTTSNTSTVASKTFTTQADKAFEVGKFVHIQSRGTLNRWMEGRVTAYSGTSLTVAVERFGTTTSAGTDWDIYVSGAIGVQGIQGVPGIATLGYAARSSNTALVTADSAHWYDLTGTFTQTFAAASAIGVDWYVVLRNAGTGDITLDPNGSETIDGLTSFIMYPGEVRLIQCDGTTFRSVVHQGGVKVYTSSDTFRWPPGLTGAVVDVEAGGGGGGRPPPGGSGATGGGGGGGGGREQRAISALPAGTVQSVVVGSGGAGATASNSAGLSGGHSAFGDSFRCEGGRGGTQEGLGGIGGNANGQNLNPPASGNSFGSAGGSANNNADKGGGGGGGAGQANQVGRQGGHSLTGGGGGGQGGPQGGYTGGSSGWSGGSGSWSGGFGTGGSDNAANGQGGTAAGVGYGGAGGGGGGGATNGVGGKGGDGMFPSGGGGGGGASSGTTGNGGNGGAGRIVVRMF